jgi:hypothetical protein
MKTNINRGAIYLVLVISLSIGFNYSRIAIKFNRAPKEISDIITRPARVVFIYGNPCTICSSGQFLLSLADQPAKDKSLVFGCARRECLFSAILPSNHHQEV